MKIFLRVRQLDKNVDYFRAVVELVQSYTTYEVWDLDRDECVMTIVHHDYKNTSLVDQECELSAFGDVLSTVANVDVTLIK